MYLKQENNPLHNTLLQTPLGITCRLGDTANHKELMKSLSDCDVMSPSKKFILNSLLGLLELSYYPADMIMSLFHQVQQHSAQVVGAFTQE